MADTFTFPSAPSECVEQVTIGSSLFSKTGRYDVASFLGQGSFGNVAKCVRVHDVKIVAVKMIKNQKSHIRSAMNEYAALNMLKQLDVDQCNLVRWNNIFMDKGYICLEFEHLQTSLFDFMRARYFKLLTVCEIRPILQQVAVALHHLQGIGLIHADLKLENIMFVNHSKEPYRVKVIDFGIAVKSSKATAGTYTQSINYRSPEVLLGLPLTTAIDVWSLGCVAAYLYLSCPLYSGSTEYNMLQAITETQGAFPKHMLENGLKTSTYFLWDQRFLCWRLKTPEQYLKDTMRVPNDKRKLRFQNLDQLLYVQPLRFQQSIDKVAEVSDRQMFVDLVKGMLQPDPHVRLTPRKILLHKFFSLSHLKAFQSSTFVKSTMSIMGRHLHSNLVKQFTLCTEPTKPSQLLTSSGHEFIAPCLSSNPTAEEDISRVVGVKRNRESSSRPSSSSSPAKECKRKRMNSQRPSPIYTEHQPIVPHQSSKPTVEEDSSRVVGMKRIRESSPRPPSSSSPAKDWKRKKVNSPGSSRIHREHQPIISHLSSKPTVKDNSRVVGKRRIREGFPKNLSFAEKTIKVLV